MKNFTKAVKRSDDDGRDASLNAIRKVHRRGPTQPPALRKFDSTAAEDSEIGNANLKKSERRARSFADDSLAAIQDTLAERPRAFRPGTIADAPSRPQVVKGRGVDAIKKSRGIDQGSLTEIVTRHTLRELKKMRKAAPQSSNGEWDDVTADTGATNDWNDENGGQGTTSSRMGGFTDTKAKTPPTEDDDEDETVKAIKAVWARARRPMRR